MPLVQSFRFRDRWQSPLADIWRRGRTDRNELEYDQLVGLLEQRDRELEDHLNRRLDTRTPGVRARRTGGINLASGGAGTAVLWDTEDYDTDDFHSNTTNTSRLTVPAGLAGTYMVGYSVNTLAGGGYVQAWVAQNGSATRFGWQQHDNSAANGIGLAGSDFLYLAAGDYVECVMFQNSGGILLTNNLTTINSFWMTRVGP